MTFKKISLIVMIATASLIAGFLYHQLSLSNNNSQTDLLYELSLTDSKEQKKDLAQYKNDWLMINFWATWCAPCREEIPELNDFFKTKKNKVNWYCPG
jgi:thiol-disulfide isomerase/thioredoxin